MSTWLPARSAPGRGELAVNEVGLAWKSEIVNAAQVSTWLAGVRLLPKKEVPAEAELAVNEHGLEVREAGVTD